MLIVSAPRRGVSKGAEWPSMTRTGGGAPESLELQNWGGRTRTSNFPVNSRAVCQLTYTPMEGLGARDSGLGPTA